MRGILRKIINLFKHQKKKKCRCFVLGEVDEVHMQDAGDRGMQG